MHGYGTYFICLQLNYIVKKLQDRLIMTAVFNAYSLYDYISKSIDGYNSFVNTKLNGKPKGIHAISVAKFSH